MLGISFVELLRRMRAAACEIGIIAVVSSAGAAHAEGHLLLTGSSTVAPLASEIGKRYEKLHPGVRIDVQTGGSGRGIADVRQGLADIGLVSRALKIDESDLRAYTIALDGVTVIVNRKNPVNAIPIDQLRKIYTGKIRDWAELGSPSGKIVVESKAEGRSTLELFLDFFNLKSSDIVAHVIVGDNEEAIKFVSGNPLAIGYVSIGSSAYAADNGVAIKPLPLGGVAPTVAAVSDKTFPLIRELNLVVKTTPEGLTKDFIDFAQSRNVDDLAQELFFVPAR